MNDSVKRRGLAFYAWRVLTGIVAALIFFRYARLFTDVPSGTSALPPSIALGILLAGIALILASFFVDVVKGLVRAVYLVSSKNLRLEIKANDGKLLATDLDPNDVQKIAQIVEEAKVEGANRASR